MPQQQPSLIPILITVLILLPVLYFRMKRTTKARPLKLQLLWIRPGIFAALALLVISTAPVPAAEWLWLVGAAVLGGGIGWVWGSTMALHVDPEHGALMVKGSQAAMLFLVVLIVLRMGLRAGLQMESAALNLTPTGIADIFIVFAAALFGVQTLEMYLRAKRILAENRAKPGQNP